MPKLSFWQVMKYYIVLTRAFMGFWAIDKTYAENLPSVKEVVSKGLPYSRKTQMQGSAVQITRHVT